MSLAENKTVILKVSAVLGLAEYQTRWALGQPDIYKALASVRLGVTMPLISEAQRRTIKKLVYTSLYG